MKNPKLSIIVPIYNVAPYLRKCFDSLLHQDYDDYEIILVDDGSTDGSGDLADELADALLPSGGSWRETGLIRVIHQENQGLSGARNTGIKAAIGEYVQFVDSDDYLVPNTLSKLMAQIERDNLDVLRFRYQHVHIVNDQYVPYNPYKTDPYAFDDYSEVPVDGLTFLNERMGMACYAVMFVLRSELAEQEMFKEGIYYEDTEWLPRMLVKAKRVASTHLLFYNYLMRDGSITNTSDWSKKRKNVESLFIVNDSLEKLAAQISNAKWIKTCICDNMYVILNMVLAYDYDHIDYWIDRLKQVNAFPLDLHKRKFKIQIKYILINISPKLYCKLLHALH